MDRENFRVKLLPDCAAGFQSSERSPAQQALSAMNLPGGRNQPLNVRRIKRIDHQAGETDEVSAPVCISDTKDSLDWNVDLDNANDSEDNWGVDIESGIEVDNGVKDSNTPEQGDVSPTQIVPAVVRRWS